MKFWPVITFLLLQSNVWARPYRMLIVADKESLDQANKFKSFLMTKPPYSKMKPQDIEINVRTVGKDVLDCKNADPRSPTLVQCNTLTVAGMKANSESDEAMIFTSQAMGGSGGDIAIASSKEEVTTSDGRIARYNPNKVMLHEMMHGYGCTDEYEYSRSEAEIHCKEDAKKNYYNLAYFEDRPPYKNDPSARQIHREQVSWMSEISSTTPITQNSELGTPRRKADSLRPNGQQIMGLYRGGACNIKTKAWIPFETSIMNGYNDDTIYPFYERLIVKSIESKLGRKLQLEDCPPPGNASPLSSDSENGVKAIQKMLLQIQL